MPVRAVLLLLFTLAGAVPAGAQGVPPAVARWQARQQAALARVDALTCVEESRRRVEGPSGSREIVTVAGLRAPSGDWMPQRTVRRAEMNGRAVPPDQWHRMLRFMQHGRRERRRGEGPPAPPPSDALLLLPRLFDALRPVEAAHPDSLAPDARRFDFAGTGGGPVEGLTLWLAPRADRLVRSRLLTRHLPEDPPLVVETEYDRRAGLDLPTARRVSGSMIVRKRSRTFTLHYDQQIAYRDCQLEHRPGAR